MHLAKHLMGSVFTIRAWLEEAKVVLWTEHKGPSITQAIADAGDYCNYSGRNPHMSRFLKEDTMLLEVKTCLP